LALVNLEAFSVTSNKAYIIATLHQPPQAKVSCQASCGLEDSSELGITDVQVRSQLCMFPEKVTSELNQNSSKQFLFDAVGEAVS
jgi:hypothetical protein